MILFKRVTAALTAVTTIAWYIAPPLAQIQESDLFSGVFSGLFAQEVLQVQAEEYEYAGFTYSISDTGAMITGYTGEDTVIVIPETVGDGTSVTEIGERAFYECTALTGVTFPDTLTEIGWDAFYGCTALTSVTIPESVTFIDSYAFSDCTDLSEIILSEGLTELGCRVFAKTAIETIAIPSTLEITDAPFADCEQLTSFTLADGMTIVPEGLFAECTGLTDVTIPDGITAIDHDAFYKCTALTNVILPDALTMIGERAFYECTALTGVTFPDSLTEIGWDAFYGCTSLTSVTIPESVTFIDSYAFSDCTDLSEIILSEGLTELGCRVFAKTAIETIAIPSTLEITDAPFADCEQLTSFTLAEEITSVPEDLFAKCTGLTDVTIPDGVTQIGERAFYECTALTGVTFPDSLTEIGWDAFYGCTSLTSVTIPESVTFIDSYAFSDCTGLSEIILSEGLTELGYRVFAKTAIETITIPSTLETADSPFADCEQLTSFTLADGMTIVPEGLFAYCTSLTECELPDTVTEIARNAFFGCTGLTSVKIPENVAIIDDYAFERCTNLAQIMLPESLTELGYRAFSETAIESVVIPSAMERLDEAFADCDQLTYVEFANGTVTVPDYACKGCSALQTVYLPDTVSALSYYSFADCTALSAVIGGSDTVSFQPTTFENCISLFDHRFTLMDRSSYLLSNADQSAVNGVVHYTLHYQLVDAVADASSDYYLNIDLPEGMVILPESISSDVIDEEYSDLTSNGFYMTEPEGTVRFSCRILEHGEYAIGAQLQFYYNDEWWSETIGRLDVDVPQITCSTIRTTNSFEIDVHGITDKGSEVVIYIDGMPSAAVTANDYTGRYSTTVTLPKKESGASYVIYAQSNDVLSDEVEVVYEEGKSAIKSVTLIYNGGNRADITHVFTEGASPVFSLSSTYYQFEIEADHNEQIFKMFVTSTKGKDTKRLEAFWNPEKQRWITEGYFDPENASYLAGSLNISIVEHTYLEYDQTEDPNQDVSLDKIPQDVLDHSSHEVIAENENETLLSITISDGVDSVDLKHYYGSCDEMVFHDQTVSKEEIARSPESYGYTRSSIKTTKDDVVYHCYYRDVTSDFFDSALNIYDYMTGFESGVSILMIAEGEDKDNLECIILNDIWEGIYDYSTSSFTEITPSAPLIDMIGAGLEFGKNYHRAQTDTERNMAYAILIGRTVGTVAGVILPPPYNFIASFGIGLLMDIFQYELDQYYKGNGFLRMIIDPSGFVYEAVTGNRIEGAKLSIYYQDPDSGEAVLWNAEDYDQSSILYSDADGRYAWDVPEGMWQVKCEMEGYETLYSEWVPVPPVQTDINFSLISYAVPELVSAAYSEDGIVLKFSKFMNPETMTAETITLACAEDYTVEPIFLNAGDLFADTYLISGDFTGVGLETITCSSICESYSGVSLTACSVDLQIGEEEQPPQSLLGDVDQNQVINADDAVLTLKEYALSILGGSLLDEVQSEVADVNSDQIVNSDDAVLILKYYAADILGGADWSDLLGAA